MKRFTFINMLLAGLVIAQTSAIVAMQPNTQPNANVNPATPNAPTVTTNTQTTPEKKEEKTTTSSIVTPNWFATAKDSVKSAGTATLNFAKNNWFVGATGLATAGLLGSGSFLAGWLSHARNFNPEAKSSSSLVPGILIGTAVTALAWYVKHCWNKIPAKDSEGKELNTFKDKFVYLFKNVKESCKSGYNKSLDFFKKFKKQAKKEETNKTDKKDETAKTKQLEDIKKTLEENKKKFENNKTELSKKDLKEDAKTKLNEEKKNLETEITKLETEIKTLQD